MFSEGSMDKNPKTFYEFGPFRIDATEQQLWRDGQEIPLSPKAFSLLLALVSNHGRTVSKDDLIREVWPDSFVEEGNLADNVSILRQALGDDAKSPHLIKTVPRRGYRFLGEVVEVEDEEVDLILAERTRTRIVIEDQDKALADPYVLAPDSEVEHRSEIAPLAIEPPARQNSKRVFIVAIACLLLGLSTILFYIWHGTHSSPISGKSAPIRSIAVLPFKPLVTSEREESLEMGMADTLIAKLSRIDQLTVRPISAVRQYTKLEDEAARAGQELQVDSVLDGSIQRAGDRVRVTVRLIRPAASEMLWTEQFDTQFTDIFTVQDTISSRVASALALQLNGAERKSLSNRETNDSEAYQLYLKGRYFWNKFSPADHLKAAGYFEQAIAKDPHYALAYSGLADTYSASAVNNWIPPREGFPKGKAAAEEALAIDDSLAEAHASLGAAYMFFDLDWQAAEREFKRAIELNPRYVETYGVYSYLLSATGRLNEAVDLARQGLQVNPLSASMTDDLAQSYYLARQYDEAIRLYHNSLEMEPNRPNSRLALGIIYEQQGKFDDAIAEYRKAISSSERTSALLGQLGHAFAASGRKNDALITLVELHEASKRSYASPYDLAVLYTGLGDQDKALQQLKRALDERSGWIINLKVEPQFDSLRRDPRYAELLSNLNLPT
jgi:DNA-binding winged helix-turn-helix (wHTH) protein/TolB-like protein/Flp pilus assembly protein TadD